MAISSKNEKLQSRLQHIVSIVLIFVIAGMLGWLSTRYTYHADWTATHSNSLSDGSRKLLGTLKGPVKLTAFIYPDEGVRREITSIVARYQRIKPDIELKFVDPAKSPKEVRELNIGANGEVVVEYQGRRENLHLLNEQTLSTALQRLAYSGEAWIVFLEGHGERSINGQNPSDFGALAKELRDKGLKVQGLNLARTPSIPDNTSALVIASPQNPLLSGEVQIIRDFVKKGGNLLWLSDPDRPAGLEGLAQDLQVNWLKGTMIYPDFQILGTGHPAIALVMDYDKNSPITQDLTDITVFPLAGAVKSDAGSGWQAQPFLTSPARSWLETGSLEANLSLDEKQGDLRGPLNIGIALQRDRPGAPVPKPKSFDDNPQAPQQRVALIADSDFMSNATLKNLGNLQLATNILQWLAQHDAQISINILPAPDAQLFLPPWAFMIIGGGFAFALPALLLLIGVTRWWLRRRR